MEEQIIDIAINSFTPVMEAAVVLAGEYCKACGRSTMTSVDMQYALRYSARNVTGRTQGSMFPELQEDDEEMSDVEEVDEEDEPFTRYQGDDPQMVAINECYDTWDTWTPASPMEQMIKSSIDKIGA